jgi:hypothetical protein
MFVHNDKQGHAARLLKAGAREEGTHKCADLGWADRRFFSEFVQIPAT